MFSLARDSAGAVALRRRGASCAAGARGVLLGALALPACLDPSSEPLAPSLSAQRFRDEAEPVLMERCANPSCHGQPDRPLAIFAPHRYRLDPAETFRDTPLTELEHERNRLRAMTFVSGLAEADASLLLRKPLAASEGGVDHQGGALFLDPSVWDYGRLYTWIAAELDASGEIP